MNCDKVRELASEYTEGTLPTALERTVREHVSGCRACEDELEALGRLWSGLEALPSVDPPPFFHENVMAAVGREAQARRPWRVLLPQFGRLALGTAAVAGAVATIAWTLLLPASEPGDTQRAALPSHGSVLPGSAATEATAASPRLRISRKAALLSNGDPAVEFAFGLENVDRGTVRVHLLPASTLERRGAPVRFVLYGSAPQTLIVSHRAVEDDTMNLHVFWTAGGQSRTRMLFVPILRSDTPPAERQSFGLPQESLYAAARDVAARYNVPVTIDNVPDIPDVTVVAREETAVAAFGRALDGKGIEVSVTGGGLLLRAPVKAVGEPETSSSGS